jgi:hypothetical protein
MPGDPAGLETAWLTEVGFGEGAGKIAETAEEGTVSEKLVGVVDVGGAVHCEPLAGLGLDTHADPIPAIAADGGVTAGGPAGNVTGVSTDGVEGDGLWSEVYGVPGGVVEGGAGPERGVGGGVKGRVADVEFPGTVEGDDAVAEDDLGGAGGLSRRRGLSERRGGAGEGNE